MTDLSRLTRSLLLLVTDPFGAGRSPGDEVRREWSERSESETRGEHPENRRGERKQIRLEGSLVPRVLPLVAQLTRLSLRLSWSGLLSLTHPGGAGRETGGYEV